MALPGFPWLKRNLRWTDEVSGGYQTKMAHPVAGGAGFLMDVVLVFPWLGALIPLSAWQVGRAFARAARRS